MENGRRGRGRPAANVAGTDTAANNGAGSVPSSPQFSSDFWMQLPPDKRQIMHAVFLQYKNQQIDYRQFLSSSREMLGESLYGQLYQRLSATANNPSASMPSIASSSDHTYTSNANNQPERNDLADNEVDVLKIDAANLQDVMQYTGFDLRNEAESMQQAIYSSPYLSPAAASLSGSVRQTEDIRSLPQYYFNATRLHSILSFYCRQSGIGEVDERVMAILGFALQTRVRDVLELLVRASRHRVDYGRRLYKIKIENDPKKQFWLLERLRTNPPWARDSKDDEEKGPSQSGLLSEHSLLTANPQQQQQKGQQQQQQQPSKDAKKKQLQKREEQSIKSKITNVTAMAAAGMKQRSWMSKAAPAALGPEVEKSESIDNPDVMMDGGGYASASDSPSSQPINLANAPSSIPLTDHELAGQFKSRTINRNDFLAACLMDSRLRRSRLHIQLLDLAPLL